MNREGKDAVAFRAAIQNAVRALRTDCRKLGATVEAELFRDWPPSEGNEARIQVTVRFPVEARRD